MKEPYGESLANYADLKSCADGGDTEDGFRKPRQVSDPASFAYNHNPYNGCSR